MFSKPDGYSVHDSRDIFESGTSLNALNDPETTTDPDGELCLGRNYPPEGEVGAALLAVVCAVYRDGNDGVVSKACTSKEFGPEDSSVKVKFLLFQRRAWRGSNFLRLLGSAPLPGSWAGAGSWSVAASRRLPTAPMIPALT